jgi:hypothetical protein
LNIVSHNTTWNKERERGKEREKERNLKRMKGRELLVTKDMPRVLERS